MRLSLTRDATNLLKGLHLFRSFVCGDHAGYDESVLGESSTLFGRRRKKGGFMKKMKKGFSNVKRRMWRRRRKILQKAKSKASKVKSTITSKVKNAAVGAAKPLVRELIIEWVMGGRKNKGRKNLEFFCEASRSTLDSLEPTALFAPKDSFNRDLSDGNVHRPYVAISRKYTDKCDANACKQATKASADELKHPSVMPGKPWVMCEGVANLTLTRCNTCCCKDGLLKSDVQAALTFKAKGARGTTCGLWFSGMDMFMRTFLAVLRFGQIVVWQGPACFNSKIQAAIQKFDQDAAAQLRKSEGDCAVPNNDRCCPRGNNCRL